MTGFTVRQRLKLFACSLDLGSPVGRIFLLLHAVLLGILGIGALLGALGVA